MALSGSMSTTVHSNWKLSISWTATQNIANNTSTITAKMYWEGDYAVYSSATKTSAIQHDGGAWSTESSAGMASLSAGQKKLINTYTFTLTHDSDGKKTFSLDGYFDAEVDISGYVGRINIDEQTFTLNTIPRKSSITSSRSWTAGNNLPVSIDRKSSSFTHDIEVYVAGTKIKTVTGIGTSTTISFTASENEDIFQLVDNNTSTWSQPTYLKLTTKSGSTVVGTSSTSDFIGTCTSPTASTVSGGNFTVGSSTTINITNEKHPSFVYDLVATIGGYSKTLLSKSTSLSIAWNTNNDKSGLLGALPKNSGTITYTLTTYWANGASYTKVRNATTDTATVNVNTTTEAPTFAPSGANAIYYKDTDTAITAKTGQTGNNGYILQNKSTLTVTLPSGGLATAGAGTSIVEYVCTFNGKSKSNKTNLTATQTFVFSASELDVSTNQAITIKAVDGRGNAKSASPLTVKIVPYQKPVIITKAFRDDGFSDACTIALNGSVSPVTIDGVNKNALVTYTYAIKASTTSSFPAGTAFVPTGFPSFTTTTVPKQLASTSSWDVYFYVKDNFDFSDKIESIMTGQPIFFVDSAKKSLGFNDYPTGNNEFRFNGRLVFGANMWTSNTGSEGSGAGAMYLNNSDMTGVNGIWFNDTANNRGEGLLFPKTGTADGSTVNTDYSNFYIDGEGWICINGIRVIKNTPNDSAGFGLGNGDIWGANAVYFNDTSTGGEGLNFIKTGKATNSTNNADYDTFRVLDGTGYLNDVPIFTSDSEVLWSGGWFMTAGHTVTPTKRLDDCPNGWMLVWSDYASGATNDFHWVYTPVHKAHIKYASGTGVLFPTPSTLNGDTTFTTKYCYVNPTTITGNDANDDTTQLQNIVLRKVLSW